MNKATFSVLVADDDEMTTDTLSFFIKEEGYQVLVARDGQEALSQLQANTVHAVLTDYRMPRIDGVELMRQALLHNPDVAVIIMTAFGDRALLQSAIANGAFNYLKKPFQIEEVIFSINSAYERALLIMENRELRNILRDTFQDIVTLNSVARQDGATGVELRDQWLKRMLSLAAADERCAHED